MKSKIYTLKYVGKLPIAVFICLYDLPALAYIAFKFFYSNDELLWKIMDSVVFGTLFLWFIIALFIHPVKIKTDGTLVVINFMYPFRETFDIKGMTSITYQEVPVVLGRVKCITLHFDSQQKNIFITDVEEFCKDCLHFRPDLQISL